MEEVEWEAHESWFHASLLNPNRLLLMCFNEKIDENVGVVRFDFEANVDSEKGRAALISINLAPSMRGKGLSKPCLTAALAFLTQHYPSYQCVLAEIKSSNSASRKSFEGVGFKCLREEDGVGYFELETS